MQCPSEQPSKLYRLVNPDTEYSRYTTTPAPKSFTFDAEDGFEFDGVVARVFETKQPATVPLYHLFKAATQDSFYTRDPRERDATLEKDHAYLDMGVAAHVFPRRICGGMPFFRLYKNGNHFYTADRDEKDDMVANDGYTSPVITGYVITAN